MTRLSSLIVLKPVSFFFILAFVVLVLPCLLIPYWYSMMNRIESQVDLNFRSFHYELQSEIDNKAKLLHLINSSAVNLATVLGSSFNGTQLSFSQIETMVAPVFFQALSTIPDLSQISYIGLEGLSFSYYTDGNQTLAMYSNSSFPLVSNSSNLRKNYIWYKQQVNQKTGNLYGKAIESSPSCIMVNTSWFQQALNSTHVYASLGTMWNNSQDLLFLNTVRIDGGGGVISLGFPVKALTNYFTSMDRQGGSLYLATKDGKILVEGLQNTHMVLDGNSVSFQLMKPNGDLIGHVGNVSCNNMENGKRRSSNLNILGKDYTFYCSPIDIVGVQSVYALAFPQNKLVSLVHKNRKVALLFLVLMIVTMFVSIISFVFIIFRAAKREMHLCAALIKQMEATQQAERKSMNKSHAFASASHDVRASLAGLTGLIEISYDEVPRGSELETNLRQMDACTKDLLGILNSILDTSKIEAGKMQLEEEEFDLAQLLEDVVDLYHPLGIKKGVDVVLDPYDGSIINFSHVKGDRGKLKQIFCNLLSNAVKFTCDGHVTVRAWVRKPSLQNSIIASNQNSMKCLTCLFSKNNETYYDLEAMSTAQQSPDSMEFVFEVDDTGKGIPKEKQKSVFENYVQVKETALGQGGTGLGLGIVQSLVRLMHGDIGIVDKEIGERGTCFRFNVLLNICENNVSFDNPKEDDIEMGLEKQQSLEPNNPISSPGLTVRSPRTGLCIRTPSPMLAIHNLSPKLEASHVVLLIQNDERRKTTRRFMESLGIKVSVVKNWEHLPSTLKKIKYNRNHSHHNSAGKSDFGSQSDYLSKSAYSNSSLVERDVPLSSLDGSDYILSVFKRTSVRGASSFILIVIDASSGPFSELCRIVSEFKRGLHNTCCKVIWLEKPTMRSINFNGIGEDVFDPKYDVVLSKPFHGSRLYGVVRLLPEFGGTLQGNLAKMRRGNTFQGGKIPRDPSSSRTHSYTENSPTHRHPPERVALQEHGCCSENHWKKIFSPNQSPSHGSSKSISPSHVKPPQEKEIQECDNSSNKKPLSGKKFLVAEDNQVMRTVAMARLLSLGATVKLCENGEEALELVRNGLSDQKKHGASHILPYDYILMDCEMPIMDGYEATKQIRKLEKRYGVHFPIIALTAHTSGEQADRRIEAGMDVHLGKPLAIECLLEAIRYIQSK